MKKLSIALSIAGTGFGKTMAARIKKSK